MSRILLFFVVFISYVSAFASHIPGGNITYQCLGNDQYVITLTLFEDCGTAFETANPKTIDISNDCGIGGLTQATLQNVIYAQEVSQLCDAQLPFSECNGGAMPGIYMHQWTDTITLPSACDSWHFSFTTCCRNVSENLVGGSNNYYIETTLNNADAVCNTSPTVTTQMIPYICVNQPIVYNLGIYEADGDNLVYSLIDAAQSGSTSVPYQGGYTGTSPIPGITINPNSGDLSFTPNLVGNYVVVVLVEEYDDDGNLIGSLTQDFQFEVINCPANTNPVEPSGISNFSAGGIQLSSNEIEVCPGDSISFQLQFTDLNPGDSIFISSNLNVALPGAYFHQLTYQSPAIAEIQWVATTSVPSNTNVVFNARDNACPMFGITFFPLSIFINPGVDAGPDVILCAGDTAYLEAENASAYSWTYLPGGDSLIVGNNFGCDTCALTYAAPANSTYYEVTGNLTSLCKNVDTVLVSVVPDFSYSLTQSSTTSCIGSDVSLEAVMNPSGAYDILWSPAAGLDDPTIANPTLTTSVPGSTDYSVTITSPLGCQRLDTISVFVSNGFNPDYEVITSATDVSCEDTVFFDVNILSGSIASCGLSASNICTGTTSDYLVGTPNGSNNSTTYPTPFGNWYKNAKHQFLYTASELHALGLTGGKITDIAWEVLQINGDTVYYDYTINMGCTSSAELTTWETGLVNVYTPQNVSLVTGVNTLPLTNAYEWDGISNLVVEVCYNNLFLNYSQNSSVPWEQTTSNTTLYYRSDNQNACNYFGPPTISNFRPITTFTICSIEPDLSNFQFSWQSTNDPVDDPNSDSTFAVITNNGEFELFVTNLIGGCVDSTTISVTAECCGIDEVIIDDVVCFGGNDGTLAVIPSSNHAGTTYTVEVTELGSGILVYNQSGIVDTAFVNGLTAGSYTIEITTLDGCTSDTLITINQPVQFVANISGDSVLCEGDSLQLSSTGGVSYNWTSAPSFSNNTLDTVWFIGTTSEMIYLEVTNSVGCTSLDSLSILVNSLPVVTLSNDTTICVNDTIMLTASGGDDYFWTPNAEISSQSGNSVEVWPSTTTTYQVVVGNSTNCMDSALVTITVQSLPAVDAGIDLALCLGDTTNLTGSGATSYLWIQGDSISYPLSEVSPIWPTTSNTYILQGEDVLGCVNYDTVDVTVNSLPNVDAGPDLWVCPSSTVQLQGSSDGVIFTWSPAADLSDSSILMPDASPDDTTIYYLTAENIFGCLNVDSMTVFAGGPVPTEAGISDTICEGDSVMIGGAPTAVLGTTFNWQPSGSIVDNSIGNPIVFPSSDTWYYIYTANDTCTGVDSVFVKVNPYPLADAGADFAICFGDTSQLNASGGVQYSWNTMITLSDSTIADPFVYPMSTTDYIVSVTDALGCVQSDTVNVMVNALPIADAGLNDTICYGDTTQLNASGGITYLWSPNDSISNLTVADPFVNPGLSIDYIVEVTDANNCVNTDTVTIVVNALPIIDAGPDLEMCIYDSLQLNVAGADTYLWSPDSTLNFNNIADPYTYALDDEEFIVLGTDLNGCKNADTVSLIVHNLPVVIADGDTTICYSDTVLVSVTGAVDYAWWPNMNIIDTTAAITAVHPADSMTYFVVGTDIYGCSNLDSVRILVNQLPNAFAGLDDTICFGDTTQLSASGGVMYLWSPNDSITDNLIADPFVFPAITTDYTVTVTDTNSCVNSDTMTVVVNSLPLVNAGSDLEMCIYDSIQLNVIGAVDYMWSPDSTLSSNNVADPFSYALDSETFVVLGTDANGCMNTDTLELIVHNLPVVIASADTAICIYDTASLSVIGADQYSWSPSSTLSAPNDASTLAYPLNTLVYTVEGTDLNGCQNVDSLVLTVYPLPVANAGIDVDICRGDSTQLSASGGENYSWSPTINILDELTFDPIVFPDTTLEYIVTVIDSNACVNYDSVIVNVFRVGTIADTAICLTDSIQLDVYGSPGNQFIWTPSDGLSEDNIQNPMASPIDDITYTVTVADVAGCVDQASVDIVVNEIPIVGFSYVLVPDCDGVQVEFTDSSLYANEYSWTFSNGENSDESEPITLFEYGTEANAQLSLVNSFGCETDSSFVIVLNDFDSFYNIHIPNVFTPNGDGDNDYFWVQVPGNLAECLDLKIYNRWGMVVFRSFGGITAWDGNNADGDEMPDGTYLFTIEIKNYKYEGTLTIFR
ncbi:MAG: gliding motility-associated C-terminal domain-containing protein [Flavobacteriales bacterium]|nr:gliding motility-associated C-terminal domain-containing protein [Flavobacteriales bacterium]